MNDAVQTTNKTNIQHGQITEMNDAVHLSWLWLSKKANPLTALQGRLPKVVMINRSKAELTTMVNWSQSAKEQVGFGCRTLQLQQVDIKVLNSI